MLDKGLQFKVYDLGDKVKKVPTNKKEIRETLLKWQPSYREKKNKLEKKVEKTIQERENVIEKLKNRKEEIDFSLLGNPIFKENCIIQNKVKPLGSIIKEMIQKNNYSELQNIIDKYIDLIQKCWQNGFSERTYNFTINYGMNSKEKVILIDFGELIFSKDHVAEKIKEERWIKSWSFYGEIKDSRFKKEYKKKMKRRLTLENLEKYWRKK